MSDEEYDEEENLVVEVRQRIAPHERERIVKRGRIFFSLKDPKTGNTLFLSNFPAALPESPHLQEHNIRAILSVIQFESGDVTDALAESVYADRFATNDKDDDQPARIKNSAVEGKVYHWIDMPDLQNPALLADYGASNVLEEATTFIDESLKQGNVLVHCKEGQKRSPTMFLAFMVTRGYTVDRAISTLGKGYSDPLHDWQVKYVKTRPMWISELRTAWEQGGEWKRLQSEWRSSHRDEIGEWNKMFLGEATISERVRKRKRREQIEQEAIEAAVRKQEEIQREEERRARMSARQRMKEKVKALAHDVRERQEHVMEEKQRRTVKMVSREEQEKEEEMRRMAMMTPAEKRRMFETMRRSGRITSPAMAVNLTALNGVSLLKNDMSARKEKGKEEDKENSGSSKYGNASHRDKKRRRVGRDAEDEEDESEEEEEEVEEVQSRRRSERTRGQSVADVPSRKGAAEDDEEESSDSSYASSGDEDEGDEEGGEDEDDMKNFLVADDEAEEEDADEED